MPLKKPSYSFGEIIRRVRELKRLTLKELAERVGVSESLVSQIERNKVSPSIDTLLAIADSLEIDPDYLFRDYKRTGKVTVLHREERSRLRRNGVTYEQLSLLAEGNNPHGMEAVFLEIAPGKEKGSPEFGHEGRELGIILEGRGELAFGTSVYLLSEGDSVGFASNIPHVLRNTGTGPLKAIWIISPPKMRYFGG